MVAHLADAPLPRHRRVWPAHARGGAGVFGQLAGGIHRFGGELCWIAVNFRINDLQKHKASIAIVFIDLLAIIYIAKLKLIAHVHALVLKMVYYFGLSAT